LITGCLRLLGLGIVGLVAAVALVVLGPPK
jgi:hypothetical protein